MKERSGRMTTAVIPEVKKPTLRGVVNERVEKGAIFSTDELFSYNLLHDDGYWHGSVKHGDKEWTKYDTIEKVFHHTNNVESFWKLFKASVNSTHIHVFQKHMQSYLSEFTFRANHRERMNLMVDLLIDAV